MNQHNSLSSLPWSTRLGLALTFTLALLAGIVLWAMFLALFSVLALLGCGWFWWQKRRLRRYSQRGENSFIEGEYQVEEQFQLLEYSRPRQDSDCIRSKAAKIKEV
jgi:O-antigen/teichoic acid export membrane protein